MGFETCGPNQAMVISGCCYSSPRFVAGGRVFVWPGIQMLQRISLNTMTLVIESPHVYTQLGVAISVTGIAQVKVEGKNETMLHAACQQFLGKTQQDIEIIARETLEGHQRAIMGCMTVEEIYQDRQKFSKAVFDVASTDLINMGLSIVSYTLKDIKDDHGYLRSLGMRRTAQVKRDARMGEAEAKRDSGVKQAIAKEQEMAAKFANDIKMAHAQRDFELKKTAYDQEVNTKKASSELAYDLQAAKTKQRIKEEEMQIRVVERTQQIQLQEQEIVRKERELDAEIRKPAEAEKYRVEKLAQAEQNRTILEAKARAEAVQVKGDAEAFAIEQKAMAEAEQMTKKAEAFKQYGEAARIEMVLEAMPQIAAEVAAPLSKTKKVTMVSSGQNELGAAKLTGEVFDIMERMPKIFDSMIGVDVNKMMKSGVQQRG